MDGRVGALLLDDPEHRAAGGVDDRERLRAGRAERDARGRVVAAGPDVAGRACASAPGAGGPLERRVAEEFAVGVVERRLERRRADVAVEDARVLVVEDRGLDAAAQQRLAARA